MNRSCFLTLFAGLLALLTATPEAAAYLHPGLGRFVQRDPAGHVNEIELTVEVTSEAPYEASAFPSPENVPLQYRDGPNLYQYARSAPSTRRDPTGFYTLMEAAEKRCEAQCSGTTSMSCRGRCMREFRRPGIEFKRRLYDNWIAYESASLAWMAGLPDCPCSICPSGGGIKNPDPSVWDDPHTPTMGHIYHPGAVYEIRSKVPNAFGAGQQCTYTALGKLIKSPFGAGTADRIAVAGSLASIYNYFANEAHMGHDKNPFDLAYELDGNRHGLNALRYLSVRRINQGVGGCP